MLPKQNNKVWTKNGMRQIIETGFKAFDNNLACLPSKAYTNQIGGLVYTQIVRSQNDIKRDYPPFNDYKTGELTEFDLKIYKERFGRFVGYSFFKKVFDYAEENPVSMHFYCTRLNGEITPFAAAIFAKDGRVLHRWAKSNRHYETLEKIFSYIQDAY